MSVLDRGSHADEFAAEWIAAWNAHDLDRILQHYAPEVEFTSPFVSRLLDNNENTLRGVAALRVYFRHALNAYPSLCFVSRGVYVGVRSLVIVYHSVSNLLAAEVMEFNEAGLVCRVCAHYVTEAAKSKD